MGCSVYLLHSSAVVVGGVIMATTTHSQREFGCVGLVYAATTIEVQRLRAPSTPPNV